MAKKGTENLGFKALMQDNLGLIMCRFIMLRINVGVFLPRYEGDKQPLSA